MLNNSKSQEYVIYGDPNFTYSQGEYFPQKLLMIGFLYCQYSDDDTHADDMWLLINPKLDDHISREKVRQFVQDLMHVSVTQRLTAFRVHETEVYDDTVEAYLKDCQNQQESAVDRIMSRFDQSSTDRGIDREQFIDVLGKHFLRTYLIRNFIQGKDVITFQELPIHPEKRDKLDQNVNEDQAQISGDDSQNDDKDL
eukprot:403377442